TKVETVFLQEHVVAGTVPAITPDRSYCRVLFRLLVRVEIAGQSDATNDQFADIARANGISFTVDDHQIPAVERTTNRHGMTMFEHRSGSNNRCLSGTVGIPHLPVLGG